MDLGLLLIDALLGLLHTVFKDASEHFFVRFESLEYKGPFFENPLLPLSSYVLPQLFEGHWSTLPEHYLLKLLMSMSDSLPLAANEL